MSEVEYADPIPQGTYWLDVPENQLGYWYLWVKSGGSKVVILRKSPWENLTWFLFNLNGPVKRWPIDLSPSGPGLDAPNLGLPKIAQHPATLTAEEAHTGVAEQAAKDVAAKAANAAKAVGSSLSDSLGYVAIWGGILLVGYLIFQGTLKGPRRTAQ